LRRVENTNGLEGTIVGRRRQTGGTLEGIADEALNLRVLGEVIAAARVHDLTVTRGDDERAVIAPHKVWSVDSISALAGNEYDSFLDRVSSLHEGSHLDLTIEYGVHAHRLLFDKTELTMVCGARP
jgi:hypothetical protein